VHLATLFQLLAIVLERVCFEPFEADTLEEPRRDDAIGVDVVAAQWNGTA
jgi:hypothetical protein